MKVLNKRDVAVGAGAYIGRGSAWGNPYVIGKHGDRDEVIRKFREYASAVILDRPDWLVPLEGRDLVCFCAPLACHGDVLVEMIGEKK
jgi:hypothetical protein